MSRVVVPLRERHPAGEPAVRGRGVEVDPGETTATCSVCGAWGVADSSEVAAASAEENALVCLVCDEGLTELGIGT